MFQKSSAAFPAVIMDGFIKQGEVNKPVERGRPRRAAAFSR
jgi:hypothetical protein